MKYGETITELEELLTDKLLTEEQKDDIRDTIKVLRSHQILSEGKESGAEHKLERIVAKLKKEKTENLADNAVEATKKSRYQQGYVTGISNALSIVLGEIEDE